MRLIIAIALLIHPACTESFGEGASASAIVTRHDAAECPLECPAVNPPPASAPIVIGAAAARTPAGGPDFFGDRWIWHTYGTSLFYPLIAKPGCAINGVHHRVIKLSNSTTAMTLRLVKVVDGANTLLGSSSVTAPGVGTISIVGAYPVIADAEYQVQADKTAGPAGDDQSLWVSVDLTCP